MKEYIKTGFMIAAVSCWCALMYPELVMNPAVVQVITQLGESEATDEVQEYYRMLSAEPEQIKIKFRIVEYMKNMR